jgi:hypothetical protein
VAKLLVGADVMQGLYKGVSVKINDLKGHVRHRCSQGEGVLSVNWNLFSITKASQRPIQRISK